MTDKYPITITIDSPCTLITQGYVVMPVEKYRKMKKHIRFLEENSIPVEWIQDWCENRLESGAEAFDIMIDEWYEEEENETY